MRWRMAPCAAAFAIVPRAMLAAALEQIDAIVRPPSNFYFTELRAQTGKLHFLPAMLRSVTLGPLGDSAGVERLLARSALVRR